MSETSTPRVAIVTGAGRGIGRAHALELARLGNAVVVNDLGGSVNGDGTSSAPADDVVAEIEAAGGRAASSAADIASADGAEDVVAQALDMFGRLDVLVNNAGILRDRMLTNLADEEWDAVIHVHLRGTFLPMRAAARHWRALTKAGEAVDARIINTSSASGLFGNPGQANYGAAKAGIASLTIIAAQELERYGVTVNAVAPGARTRMTESLGYGSDIPESAFDWSAPENISPVVGWLATPAATNVTGRVIEVLGGRLCVLEGWRRGPAIELDRRWEHDEVGPALTELLSRTSTPEGMHPASSTVS